jgi:creatinine amidohydrolase
MTTSTSVRWAELRPDDFRARRDACPIVYLPIGLCEPHGHIAALGLDLLKAEYFCEQAAQRFGGIVAPAQGYHIHECGFNAPWLAEVVGEENPFLGAIPPHVMLHLFLYQLRSFALAGFQGVIAVSGHAGGSQDDLRLVAHAFTEKTGLAVIVKTDPEWIPGLHAGDHAGRYEISQLMDIRPDLVDLSLLGRQFEPNSGGRLAVGEDAAESSAAYGQTLNEAIIAAIGRAAIGLVQADKSTVSIDALSYEAMERIWQTLYATISNWNSVSPRANQITVPANSRWHAYVHVATTLAARGSANTV